MEYHINVRVTVESEKELSEDAKNVIDDLKEELSDAIENVLEIEDEDNIDVPALINSIIPGAVVDVDETNSGEQNGAEQNSSDEVSVAPVFFLDWF